MLTLTATSWLSIPVDVTISSTNITALSTQLLNKTHDNTQLWFSRLESWSQDSFLKVLVMVFWLFFITN